MNDIKRLKEEQKDIHPGFGSYLECMTRTLGIGVATFCVAFSGTYIGQRLMKKHLPYGHNIFILISSIVAVGASYQYTASRTKNCQAVWMAAEDKWTYLKEHLPDEE
ncbi:transmembrane protein 141 [Anabrus simplex]|uniref:transmembrane protein 141 n=1 Tax=Anabrus simplex TaxID=316456 RepID=UPI0035A3BAB0